MSTDQQGDTERQENEELRRLLGDSVARFAAERYDFAARSKLVASPPGFDRGHWREMAEMGWLAAPFPAELGGLGGSSAHIGAICEQLGRALFVSPYQASIVEAGAILVAAGTVAQREALVPAIAQGEAIVVCALNEADVVGGATSWGLRAVPSDTGYVLTGNKTLVPYAEVASHLIVSATVEGEGAPALFMLRTDSTGIQCAPYWLYDASRAADLTFDSVAVDGYARMQLGGPADAIDSAVNLGRDALCAALCAEASGIMWAAHDQTLAYLKTREQFGQPLAAMQALQHRIVDVYVQCQLAQSMAWDAVEALEQERHARPRGWRVSAAKAFIGDAGRQVGQEAVHLHGGIGMTDELPIGHYLKRLTAIDRMAGDSAWHRSRFTAFSDHSNSAT